VVCGALAWLGCFTVWGLLAPLVGRLLALLSLYWIRTSANTLTGNRVATVAIALCLVVGGAAAVVQLKDYRDRQRDKALVREQARRLGQHLVAGDWDAVYPQFAPELAEKAPSAYWTYTWNRWVEDTGPIREVAFRGIRFIDRRTLLVSLSLQTRRDGGPTIGYRLRLIFRLVSEAELELLAEEFRRIGRPASADALGQAGWRVSDVPGLIRPMPPLYDAPLTLPSPSPSGDMIPPAPDR
jgi:hypothetical protein